MTPDTGRSVLFVMALLGWILACVFGAMACLLAVDARGHDVAWKILAALVLGLMLASVPVGAILFAAFRGFGGKLPPERPSPTKLTGRGVEWRWPTFAILCGLETLVFPLTLVAAAADDDSLILSIPFNLVVITAALLVGCWPHQKRASIVICAIHLIGIAIATFAAAIEIESVVVSGLLLLISGIALVLVGTRPRTIRLLFALSTVVFILTSFLVIAIGNVGQREAEAPLLAAMVAYQVLFVPIGLWFLYRESSDRSSAIRPQFGLKHLIAVMVIVCLASALAKLAYSVNDDRRIAVAVGMGALLLAGIAAAIASGSWTKWHGHKLGPQQNKIA